jgi:hypothetical protein
MRDSEQAIVRRALLSLLDKLGGSARVEPEIIAGAGVAQPPGDGRPEPRAGGGDDGPIIIIFPGRAGHDAINNSGARPERGRGDVVENHAPGGSTSSATPLTPDPRTIRAVHPGLEKFPLAETGGPLPAPKTCFMEPGRVCVNSGACEMRGY